MPREVRRDIYLFALGQIGVYSTNFNLGRWTAIEGKHKEPRQGYVTGAAPSTFDELMMSTDPADARVDQQVFNDFQRAADVEFGTNAAQLPEERPFPTISPPPPGPAEINRQHTDPVSSDTPSLDAVDERNTEQDDTDHDRDEEALSSRSVSLDDNPRADAVAVRSRAWYHRSYSKVNRILLDTWLPEIFALLFSLACLVAIVAVLAIYHDKPLHHLPKGLTLNAIISVLAAGAKSSLMFTVGGTMSQSKWCWFRSKLNRQRCLQDLEDMDDASRGPLGSTAMLFQHTIVSLCSIGAVLVILALAFDPFVQQVVGYPVRQEISLSSEATTRQAFTLNSVPASGEIAGNVYAGIYRNSFDRTPSCPTGNCTWDPFLSAGWCGKCEAVLPGQITSDDCNFAPGEIIQDKEVVSRTCNFSISGGDAMSAYFETSFADQGFQGAYMDYQTITLMSQFGNPVETHEYAQQYFAQDHIFLGHSNPLLAFGYMHVSNVGATEATSTSRSFDMHTTIPEMLNASTCILTPCTRKYNISVTNGNTTVQVLDEDYGIISAPNYGELCWRPSSLAEQPPTNTRVENSTFSLAFNETNMAWCGLPPEWISQISSVLKGSVQMRFTSDGGTDGRIVVSTTIIEQTAPAHIDAVGGLGQVFPGIINALTDASLHATEYNNSLAVNFLNGTIWTEKVFVVVNWAWLSLPIALILGGLCFLGLTMVATRRHAVPLWKSSALSFLYHGLTDIANNDDNAYETRSDMEEAAQLLSVRLGPDPEREGRFMLQP